MADPRPDDDQDRWNPYGLAGVRIRIPVPRFAWARQQQWGTEAPDDDPPTGTDEEPHPADAG